jgi:hypothetical protein
VIEMSYDISFKVKVEGIEAYATVGNCDANVTWNVRKMIEVSTGLPWINCANNGLCVDVVPKIMHGYAELLNYPWRYKKHEAENGWGTVEGTREFFKRIICAWEEFAKWNEELAPVTTFWIE